VAGGGGAWRESEGLGHMELMRAQVGGQQAALGGGLAKLEAPIKGVGASVRGYKWAPPRKRRGRMAVAQAPPGGTVGVAQWGSQPRPIGSFLWSCKGRARPRVQGCPYFCGRMQAG